VEQLREAAPAVLRSCRACSAMLRQTLHQLALAARWLALPGRRARIDRLACSLAELLRTSQ